MRETAVRAKAGGLESVSDVALHKRLRGRAEWFRWMGEQMTARLSGAAKQWVLGKKVECAKRLRFALEKHKPSIKGPTQLANQFNLRYAGRGVSPQTAHKWLSGWAIPTPEKLATLAAWLEVSEY